MKLKSTLIIAEAGVNHNGSMELAYKLIDAAADAGADLVKFQTFNARKLVTESADKAKYQKQATDADESQYEMLANLELSKDMHKDLISYCAD
jgi:N,N'-diacetyllegionaminate synthase